jgi:small-conductance mechanosensitive channel
MDSFFTHWAGYFSLSQTYIKLLCLTIAACIIFLFSRTMFGIIIKVLRPHIPTSLQLFNTKFKIASSILFSIIVINILLPMIKFSDPGSYYLKKIIHIGFVFSLAYLLIKITEYIRDYIYLRRSTDISDNLNNRKIRTQIGFLQKVISLFILIIAISIVLMSFSRVREIGTSIIASAGIASIILGFAAQKSLSNLLAGLQIAFTQPLRIDDIVVVENEWGKIEEITLTYVVVRIWDERRLVLPISYFIEKPFQNWTRMSSQIIGTIMLYADYSAPVDIIREKMMNILQHSPLWDGKVATLQVVDCTEKSVQLRGLMSSANASDAWDLRCHVREELIKFLAQNYPDAFPKLRSRTIT